MNIADLGKNCADDSQINWVTASFMVAFHIGAIAALFIKAKHKPGEKLEAIELD